MTLLNLYVVFLDMAISIKKGSITTEAYQQINEFAPLPPPNIEPPT